MKQKDEFIHEKLKMPGCWHVMGEFPPVGKKRKQCQKCGLSDYELGVSPGYSNDLSILGIMKRLVELGRWQEFYKCACSFWGSPTMAMSTEAYALFTEWLMQQPRFRDLVASFLGYEDYIKSLEGKK